MAFATLLVLPGATYGGSYVPPPGDALPAWSPDGARIAFLTSRGGPALVVMSAVGRDQTRILDVLGAPYADPTSVALSPDWTLAAVLRFTRDGLILSAVRLDGSETHELARAAFGRPAWSHDSRRIAFRMSDGTLAAVGSDGGDFVRLATGGAAPAWSPDGRQIAYVGGVPGEPDIRVVDVNGQNDVLVAGGPGAQLEPKWSPDATRVALLTQRATGEPFAFAVVRADGSEPRTYEAAPGVSNSDAFAWTPDGRALVYARDATQGLFRLDLAKGEARRLTTFGGAPAVSPDGMRIAFAAGGECRDRYGVYVAGVDGKRVTRLTNDCRILGTGRDDVVRGTALADVLVGLGGDDRLQARDPGYMGDTLLGGDGDDLLIGAYQADVLRGGRGNDRLLAGRSADLLYGGPGHDWIDGQRGRDLLYAQDGSVDTVRCGTNDLGRVPERDEAWVDTVDKLDGDCEVVHRRR